VTIKSLELNNGCLSMVNTMYRRKRKQHNCISNDHNAINVLYVYKILLKIRKLIKGYEYRYRAKHRLQFSANGGLITVRIIHFNSIS